MSNQQSLTIQAKEKELSKSQQNFNRLVAQIEKLRKQIADTRLVFEKALKTYAEEYHPVETTYHQQLALEIKAWWQLYKNHKLNQKHTQTLQAMLSGMLDNLLEATLPDEELKAIFHELQGLSYDDAIKQQMQQVQDNMQQQFKEMGINVDLNGVDMNDAEQLQEKLQQATEQLNQRETNREEKAKKRKKTPKQLKKEELQQAAKDLQQKNISTIYKQLAKLFHPDLEQDTSKKAGKEALMKELTAAYEANNLHALLMLELKFIYNESSHLETLSEEKLKVYIQVLNEQVQDLNWEKKGIAHEAAFVVLQDKFGPEVGFSPLATIKDECKSMQHDIKVIQSTIRQLQSDKAHSFAKEYLKEEAKEQQFNKQVDEFEYTIQQLMRGKNRW